MKQAAETQGDEASTQRALSRWDNEGGALLRSSRAAAAPAAPLQPLREPSADEPERSARS